MHLLHSIYVFCALSMYSVFCCSWDSALIGFRWQHSVWCWIVDDLVLRALSCNLICNYAVVLGRGSFMVNRFRRRAKCCMVHFVLEIWQALWVRLAQIKEHEDWTDESEYYTKRWQFRPAIGGRAVRAEPRRLKVTGHYTRSGLATPGYLAKTSSPMIVERESVDGPVTVYGFHHHHQFK